MFNYENESQDISIHTFEIRMRCTKFDYDTIREGLYNYCIANKRKFYRENSYSIENDFITAHKIGINVDTYEEDEEDEVKYDYVKKETVICEALSNKGIIIRLVVCTKNGSALYYGIRMIINPRILMGDYTYVGIFDINRADNLICKLYNIFEELNVQYLGLDLFKLHRIDFCKNLYFECSEDVMMYVELLKKCNIPKGYNRQYYYYDEYDQKYHCSKNGIKVYSGSVGIVAYNKQAQMIDQNNKDARQGKTYYYSEEDLFQANGVLRFEVQFYENRLNYLNRKGVYGEIKNLRIFFLRAKEIVDNEFQIYISKVFFKGNFYTLEYARNIINDSDNTKKTKQNMLTFLENVSIHQSITKASDKVREEKGTYAAHYIRKMTERFNTMHLNPITIPVRKSNNYGTLQGPYQQLMSIDMLHMHLLE